MIEPKREQLKLPYSITAAFCLSLILLGAAMRFSEIPAGYELPPLPLVRGSLLVPELSSSAPTHNFESALRVPILMYHRVGNLPSNPNPLDRDLTVSREDFDSQVAYFKSQGYQSVTLAEALRRMDNPGTAGFPGKPIVFSFDDGWRDAFENAVPVLRKYGFIGSFAVAGNLAGRPGYATWDEILKAQAEGMEIVSHSENHLDLTNKIYSLEDLARETAGAKKELENKLGREVSVFVYPYGRYDERAIALLKQAGFRMGLTTRYGQEFSKSTVYSAPRVRVHGVNGLEKLKKVFGTADRSDPSRINL